VDLVWLTPKSGHLVRRVRLWRLVGEDVGYGVEQTEEVSAALFEPDGGAHKFQDPLATGPGGRQG
jgi:hypothetical protein